MATRYVVLYESAENIHEKAPVHFPAHSEWFRKFHAAGTLELLGTFGDPQKEGAMAIFTTREAAEEFVADDPFVTNGVVARYEIREWNEVLS